MKITHTQTELIAMVRANLTRLRVEAGLTQTELAKRAKLSVGWINDIEHGRRTGLSVASIAPICAGLGIHPAMLFLPPGKAAKMVDMLTTQTYQDLVDETDAPV